MFRTEISVFLFPSLSRKTLDLRLHGISSQMTKFIFYYKMMRLVLFIPRAVPFFAVPKFYFLQCSLWTDMLLNTSLLHFFKSPFKACNFFSSTKLGLPLNSLLCHQALTSSPNPSAFNHMFSNLNDVMPLLSPPTIEQDRWVIRHRPRK